MKLIGLITLGYKLIGEGVWAVLFSRTDLSGRGLERTVPSLKFMPKIVEEIEQEIHLLEEQNTILRKNTVFTGLLTIIAILAFILAMIALTK